MPDIPILRRPRAGLTLVGNEVIAIASDSDQFVPVYPDNRGFLVSGLHVHMLVAMKHQFWLARLI